MKLADGRRRIQLVHVPTGITVEDDGTSPLPIVARRNALEAELVERIAAQSKA